MSIKDEFQKESKSLLDVKKPYETAAFVIFAIMFIQQVFYIFISIFDFFERLGDSGMKLSDKVVSFRWGSTTNLPIFVGRILNIESANVLYMLLSFMFLGLWYVLLFFFVWNYCRKHNYAKWTWTALIAFGPANIFLVPTYLIYAIYVFRPYLFRFIKRGVEEYKQFTPNTKLDDE